MGDVTIHGQRIMKIIHTIEIVAKCPSDELGDVYECEVHTNRVIKVEDIMRLADELADKVMYQEDVAIWLQRRLQAKIVLRGSHFGRVRTKVTC
jgi:hypothetical protein